MKKMIVIMICLGIVACLGIYSCQKENAKTETDNSLPGQKPNEKPGASPKFGWLPVGSEIKSTPQGVIDQVPDGWIYIGFDEQQKLFTVDHKRTKSINCTCNAKGECKPFQATGPWGTTQGCTGTCTSCVLKQSFSMDGDQLNIESGGYFSPQAKTRLLKNGETAPAVFEALFESKEFVNEIESFIRMAYNGKPTQQVIRHDDGSVTAPMGYSLAAISVMGRGMVVVVPDEYIMARLGYVLSSKASCSCAQSGTCELKGKTILGMGSIWCDGNCGSCTLTTDGRSQGGGFSVQIQSYAF